MKKEETNKPKKDILALLAEHLGVEPEDLNEEDFFNDDLQMNPASMTDFIEKLSLKGHKTTGIDFAETETIADLLNAISSNEDL